MRRKLIDLSTQRQTQLNAAEAALKAGNQADYTSAMEQVTNLNADIQQVQDFLKEQDRQLMETQPSAAEARDVAEERGHALLHGGAVTFSNLEIRRAMNQITVATGTIAQPTGVQGGVNDNMAQVSSIVDQVRVEDLAGMGTYEVPYIITNLEADGGKVSTKAGQTRPESAAPTFGVAQIKPYEASVTQFIDRNISRLTPANYYAKVQAMAMRALRTKLAELIVSGDASEAVDMFGIRNAKNKAGNPIFAEVEASAVDENLLDSLYFAYGSDDAVGANARLYLTKKDLKAIGAIRGTNEKKRLYTITPTPGDATSGTITDGGLVVPYTIVSKLTSLDGASQTSSKIPTMLYGDPLNYTLGLFGDYTIRIDESVKALERMNTILGDVFVGGNITVDKGFVVATVPST